MKFCRLIITVPLCMALSVTPGYGAADCSDKNYAATHQLECSFIGRNTSIAGLIFGGVAAAGAGILALNVSESGGGTTTDSGTRASMPTLPTYNNVGGDVDFTHLAAVTESDGYSKNRDIYNDIRMAWSRARGYTGAGSTVAVLDSGNETWHGRTVALFASGEIAPNAIVTSYQVTDTNNQFLSYDEIGRVIMSADNANIFNASWSVSSRATAIRSRQHLISQTSPDFINALISAANRDAIFVWAAGNDYSKQSSALSVIPEFIPEMRGHFINVVAWDSETNQLAEFSNECGITMQWCITAPGAHLDTGHTIANGTSFSAPLVSAAIAVIREAFPYMTADQITQLLFTTARDLGEPGVDEVYGWGMLDLERATRPVGAPLVPLDDGTIQPLQTARISGDIGHQIKAADLHFAYLDSFGRAFETRLNENISVKNRGRGFTALRGNTSQELHAGPIVAGFKSADFLASDGFLKSSPNVKTSFAGIGGKIKLGANEFFHHTHFGITAPHAAPDSIISEFSNIYTISAHMGMSRGPWTFAVATNDAILAGDMTLRMPAGRANDGAIVTKDAHIDLRTTPAIEYSATYKFITAAFIDNPFGTDEIYMFVRKSFEF